MSGAVTPVMTAYIVWNKDQDEGSSGQLSLCWLLQRVFIKKLFAISFVDSFEQEY